MYEIHECSAKLQVIGSFDTNRLSSVEEMDDIILRSGWHRVTAPMHRPRPAYLRSWVIKRHMLTDIQRRSPLLFDEMWLGPGYMKKDPWSNE